MKQYKKFNALEWMDCSFLVELDMSIIITSRTGCNNRTVRPDRCITSFGIGHAGPSGGKGNLDPKIQHGRPQEGGGRSFPRGQGGYQRF